MMLDEVYISDEWFARILSVPSKLLRLIFSFGVKALKLVIPFCLRSFVATWRVAFRVVRVFSVNQV
jgi:hypothetical protein